MSKSIPLTRGYVTVVDDDDFDRFGSLKWRASVRPNGCVYAVRTSPRPEKRCLYLHRGILGLQAGRLPEVDHKDRDGLNNQKANLRVATHSQNGANRTKYARRSLTGFKGVSWDKQDHKWRSVIGVNGRFHQMGDYATDIEAARAYDAAAFAAWGEYALLNFPDEPVDLTLIQRHMGGFAEDGARYPYGEQHHGARLTDEAVRAIRATTGPSTELASRYGVSDSSIRRLRRGEGWPHVVVKETVGNRPYKAITADDVRTIRASMEHIDVLAQRYGFSRSGIYAIRNRVTWKHVP